MFHFPTFPPLALCVQARVTGHDSCRVSPFRHPRISALLAAPRGFSQPHTSFIGSWCQGIHRAPLLTWLQKMLASTVQFSRYGRSRLAHRRLRASRARGSHVEPVHPRRAPQPCGCASPNPQDPTACLGRRPLFTSVPADLLRGEGIAVLATWSECSGLLVSVPPMSSAEGRSPSMQAWTTRLLAPPDAP